MKSGLVIEGITRKKDRTPPHRYTVYKEGPRMAMSTNPIPNESQGEGSE